MISALKNPYPSSPQTKVLSPFWRYMGSDLWSISTALLFAIFCLLHFASSEPSAVGSATWCIVNIDVNNSRRRCVGYSLFVGLANPIQHFTVGGMWLVACSTYTFTWSNTSHIYIPDLLHLQPKQVCHGLGDEQRYCRVCCQSRKFCMLYLMGSILI